MNSRSSEHSKKLLWETNDKNSVLDRLKGDKFRWHPVVIFMMNDIVRKISSCMRMNILCDVSHILYHLYSTIPWLFLVIWSILDTELFDGPMFHLTMMKLHTCFTYFLAGAIYNFYTRVSGHSCRRMYPAGLVLSNVPHLRSIKSK